MVVKITFLIIIIVRAKVFEDLPVCPPCSKHWTKQPYQVDAIIIDCLLPARQSCMS